MIDVMADYQQTQFRDIHLERFLSHYECILSGSALP